MTPTSRYSTDWVPTRLGRLCAPVTTGREITTGIDSDTLSTACLFSEATIRGAETIVRRFAVANAFNRARTELVGKTTPVRPGPVTPGCPRLWFDAPAINATRSRG